MSTLINTTTALGKNFAKLSGPENYSEWAKAFGLIASLNGYAHLYKDDSAAVTKPTAPDFTSFRRTRQTADSEIAAQGDSFGPDPQSQLMYYNLRLQEYKEYEKSCRSAFALLQAAVEPWI